MKSSLSLRLLLASSALVLLNACQILQLGLDPLPKRDETFSYFGPGSERILKGSVPAFSFAEESSLLNLQSAENQESLEAILDKLTEDKQRQVLLAGFANDSGTAEFNRVLGDERAQAVRQALLGKGVVASRVHTVSYGNELDSRPNTEGRRVEVGFVEPDPLAGENGKKP